MPRLPRIKIKGALYYVTCRGEHAQEIFKDKGDYQMFLGLLKKYKEQYGFKLFAYALLPNHLHLLIELSEGGISEIMHDLNSAYTKYFNNKYGRKGHLFRERFKAALAQKEPYLSKLTAYIHLNPEKSNLVPNAQDYPYSSYCLYLNKGEAAESLGMDINKEILEVLSYLNNIGYLELVHMLTQEDAAVLHKNLHRGGILGSEDFVQKVRSEISQSKAQAPADSGAQASSLKNGLTILGIVLAGAGVFYFLRFNVSELRVSSVDEGKTGVMDLKDLDMTEWEIQLTPISGGKMITDTLSFDKGKFICAQLHYSGFPASNYSVVIDEQGKIIWETMQTGPQGTASWRGEIEKGHMHGMLSLRQEGKEPQDFSFVSVNYRRKK